MVPHLGTSAGVIAGGGVFVVLGISGVEGLQFGGAGGLVICCDRVFTPVGI